MRGRLASPFGPKDFDHGEEPVKLLHDRKEEQFP